MIEEGKLRKMCFFSLWLGGLIIVNIVHITVKLILILAPLLQKLLVLAECVLCPWSLQTEHIITR